MHGQINNLVGVSVFPLRGASWTVLPYQYHCFRHEDEYDIAKFLCLVNISIGHDREFNFDSKDVCDDRFSFPSKSELMNEQCARRQRSWVQKVRYIGTTVFTLKMTWRNFDI